MVHSLDGCLVVIINDRTNVHWHGKIYRMKDVVTDGHA